MSEHPADATTETFTVLGMTCGHCVQAVTDELSKLDGVSRVAVDLAGGWAVVDSAAPLDRAVVAAAVDEAGCELVP
jgi:copper chaperone